MKTYSLKKKLDDKIILEILDLLLKKNSFVSGQKIAEKLAVSRTTINSKIKLLKQSDIEIKASRNKGYTIEKIPNCLNPYLLNVLKKNLPQNFTLKYYHTIDSTNNEAERLSAMGEKGPLGIISSRQTDGKGRLGRIWEGQSSKNIYCSVLFSPNMPIESFKAFTLWAGIEICKLLQKNFEGIKLKLKWPNDILCNDKKISGMLTEAKIDADKINTLIFGIGINVNINKKSLPKNIRNISTSLYAESTKQLNLNHLAIKIFDAIIKAYNHSLKKDVSDLPEKWSQLDYLKNKKVTLRLGNKKISGIANGVDANGLLRLKLKSGQIKFINSGDVTLR